MADPDLSGYDFSLDGELERYLRGPVFNNLRGQMIPSGASDVEFHHVSTVSTMENSAFIRNVYGRENYARKFAEGRSLIALPTDTATAMGSGLAQHKGSHTGYRTAEARIHSDLLRAYEKDLADLGESPSAEQVAALKRQYSREFDRIELILRDGHVVGLHQNGTGQEWRPQFPIYGSDAHLDPSMMGWQRLNDRIYENLTLADLRTNHPWLKVAPNDTGGVPDFAVGDDALYEEIGRREKAGMYNRRCCTNRGLSAVPLSPDGPILQPQ